MKKKKSHNINPFKSFFCYCINVYVCAHVWVGAHMYTSQRTIAGIILRNDTHFIWVSVSLWPGVQQFGETDWPDIPRVQPVSSVPSLGIAHSALLHSHVGCRDFMLAKQALYQLSCHRSPCITSKNCKWIYHLKTTIYAYKDEYCITFLILVIWWTHSPLGENNLNENYNSLMTITINYYDFSS